MDKVKEDIQLSLTESNKFTDVKTLKQGQIV